MSPHEGHTAPSPEQIITHVELELKKRIEERYGTEAFHNPEHTRTVGQDSKAILKIIKGIDSRIVREDDVIACHTAALGHDARIEYVSHGAKTLPVKNEVGEIIGEKKNAMYRQRLRIRGYEPGDVPKISFDQHGEPIVQPLVGNERASADELVQLCEKIDPQAIVYTPDVIHDMRVAISATFPEFTFEKIPPEAVRILGDDEEILGYEDIQKYLTPKSPLSAFAIAIADLSYCGLYDSKEFNRRADGEYRETRELLEYEINQGTASMSEERKMEVVQDMLNWLRGQIQFVLWQKLNFQKIISENEIINSSMQAGVIRQALLDRYSHFNENITAVIDRYEHMYHQLEKEKHVDAKFILIAREFGYKV